MKTISLPQNQINRRLAKSPTGIRGLDEITGGGLPTGRPTLLCGGAGCGKTLLAMEFIVRGATQHNEPGVFVSFEETSAELAQNMASLGFDLPRLVARKAVFLEYVRVERSEIEATGVYDLEGLFIRLEQAIQSVGAKRVALDTIEALFAGLPDPGIVRAELRRLFRWLKDKGLTTVITCEQGEGPLTRHGLEEYVSDCVLFLDHRVCDQITTRRLRIVKYRGSPHGTNEYPFLIDQSGVSVWPVTSLRLEHPADLRRVSSGIPRLDRMLGGKGYFRGSTVLISGTAGTGKTSLAASFADATCRQGKRCLFFAFEESPPQILRNMRSIGLDLARWVKAGQLQFHAVRPSFYGLEIHLAQTLKAIAEFKPTAVILDPISSLGLSTTSQELKAAIMRLVDSMKLQGITALLTSLTPGGNALEQSVAAVSSLVDTWLALRDLESNGERNRGLHVLKSRGMAHSNQVREFRLGRQGIQLEDVYVGLGGVLTGTARLAQEAREKADQLLRQEELQRKQLILERKRQALASQIAALTADFAAEEAELQRSATVESRREGREAAARREMSRSRLADPHGGLLGVHSQNGKGDR